MKYIVAVSGGVDSVALLDMMSQVRGDELIVAHFDHGIRDDSAEDEAFVRALAKQYGHHYVSKREVLGASASEALARNRRYAFLKEQARKYNAKIVTAHHLDDLVETVAINLHRGTGWRGLAVFGSVSILRPLVTVQKSHLISYAKQKGLEWREDPTNTSDVYLRNRVRQKAKTLTVDKKRQLHALQATQKSLRAEINKEVKVLVGDGPEYSRYLFTVLPEKVAIECLRYVTKRRLTRPQLERLLNAVKTASHGAKFEAGMGITVQFSTRYFRL
jgi:tRNA(Ile)-lysidine synthase